MISIVPLGKNRAGTRPLAGVRRLTGIRLLAWLLVLIPGCSDHLPTTDEPSTTMTFDDLRRLVEDTDGPTRVDLQLAPGDAFVDVVELEHPVEIADDEEVEGRVVGIIDGSCPTSSLVVLTGAYSVTVRFDARTRFEVERSDGDPEVSCEDFVRRIRDRLDAGDAPRIDAGRPGRVPAQPPGENGFDATDVQLEDGSEANDKIEINLDAANLEQAQDGGGVLRVLGLELRLGPDTRFTTEATRGEELAFEDLEQLVAAAPEAARLDIDILAGRGTALVVELEEPDEITSGEELEGRVRSVDAAACPAGTLSVEVGAMETDLSFGEGTRFREERSHDLVTHSCEEFLGRLAERLTAGEVPRVEATRRAALPPQPPGSAGFVARRIELELLGRPSDELELNVGPANLGRDAAGDPVIRVLGIEIRVGPGTRLSREG